MTASSEVYIHPVLQLGLSLLLLAAAAAHSYPAVNHLPVKELLHLIGGGNSALKAPSCLK